MKLSGEWSLTDVNGDYTCSFALPGDGINALFSAGLIPDPYWGKNEYELRWICERDWVARRKFTLTDKNVDLILSEIDTVATVRVNGTTVLQTENAFRTYRALLSGVAEVGENEISVTFHSPVMAGKAKHDAHPFPIPWSENCPIPYGNFLRKPACDFGWDWNIALAPFGIYGDLAIAPSDATRIDKVMVSQVHGDNKVDLTFAATLVNDGGEATFSFAGQELTTFVIDGVATVQMTVENPDLWWPAGQGDQPLYDLVVTAGQAKTRRRIGLREVALITEPDDAGQGFKFRINRRDVFCKGANWIPTDALPGRITVEKTRALLQSAKDAHMNMIRVWGGGRYEPTSFYETCDELGLMVWQDFMFACNLYPSDLEFLENVRAEIRDNVARMHHHACLALWCGDNELVGALGWYDVSKADRDRYLVNYDRLNYAIETELKSVDPTANWWPSSPSPGLLSFGDAWHDDSSGDMHFWSVWHEGRDFDHYRDVAPRFCSEFGFQSYPSLSEITRFAEVADFNIAAPVMESHQKNPGGNARIAETMFRYFRFPNSFENFVYLSQVQQALAIKTAVSHWRSRKPHCMGTLVWQLNDTWPVASWASLNYSGEWKLLHYFATHFNAPISVVAVPEGDTVTLRGINDTSHPIDLNVTAYATDMAGNTRTLQSAQAQLGLAAEDLITGLQVAANEMLTFDWTTPDGLKGGDIFAPMPFKHYDLLPSGLAHEVTQDGDDYVLTLSAQNLALFVTAEADQPGRFDKNAIHLTPDHTANLRFTPQSNTRSPTFTLRDLHSATY